MPAVEEGPVTLIGATTENPRFEVNSALLSRVTRLRARTARRATTSRCCCARARAGRARRRRLLDDGRASSCSRRAAGGDARVALSALERAASGAGGSTVAARSRRARRRHGPLRPRRRPALRHDLGLDQGDTRLGPRRVALLPGDDARGRRGPALHRAPDGDPGLRGHRQRRPAGAGRRVSPPRRRSSTSACRNAPTRSRRRRSTSRSRRSPMPPAARSARRAS